MPVSYLDLGVIAVLLISGLLAMVRGFVREVLSISAWVAAGFAAYFLYKSLLPFLRDYIPNETVATVVAIAAIFLCVLVIVSLITVKISDAILDSRIGFLDRTLGFIYGCARGVVPVVAAFMIFHFLVQDRAKWPDWVKNARTLPMLESAENWVIGLFPKQTVDELLIRLKKPASESPPAIEPLPSAPAPAGTAPRQP